eukprot:11194427-Prorocentrum_lima.AAC.1
MCIRDRSLPGAVLLLWCTHGLCRRCDVSRVALCLWNACLGDIVCCSCTRCPCASSLSLVVWFCIGDQGVGIVGWVVRGGVFGA